MRNAAAKKATAYINAKVLMRILASAATYGGILDDPVGTAEREGRLGERRAIWAEKPPETVPRIVPRSGRHAMIRQETFDQFGSKLQC